MEVGAICEASCDGVLQDLQDTGGLWANCKKGPGGCKNQGTGAYQDMDRYEGGFKDGQRGHVRRWAQEWPSSWQGHLHLADGDKWDKYEGEWKDGLKHGRGTLTLAKNIKSKYEGVWEKGQQPSSAILNMKHVKDLAKAHGVNSQRRGKGGNSRH